MSHRWNIVHTVAAKELRDIARDRRTVLAAVLLPLVGFPLLFAVVLKVAGPLQTQTSGNVNIVVVGDVPEQVEHRLGVDLHAKILHIRGSTPDASEAGRLLSRYGASLIVSGDAASDGRTRLSVFYDPADRRSAIVRGMGEASARAADADLRASLGAAHGVPEAITNPLDIRVAAAGAPFPRYVWLVGALGPLVLFMLAAVGATFPAVELTAGDRERGTLIATLSAPVRPVDVYWGKFVAVGIVTTLSVFLATIGGGIGMVLQTPHFLAVAKRLAAAGMTSGQSRALVFYILGLGAMAWLVAALVLAASAAGRTVKESQTYVQFATGVCLTAGLVAIAVRGSARVFSVVPLVNIALLFRPTAQGSLPASVAAPAVTSILLVAAATIIGARSLARGTRS